MLLGGGGGDGGQAETATVNNSGVISTAGIASTGIRGQSIGGGGGNGGITVSGSLGASALSANIALGGAGGKGNTASQALVSNTGKHCYERSSSSSNRESVDWWCWECWRCSRCFTGQCKCSKSGLLAVKVVQEERRDWRK